MNLKGKLQASCSVIREGLPELGHSWLFTMESRAPASLPSLPWEVWPCPQTVTAALKGPQVLPVTATWTHVRSKEMAHFRRRPCQETPLEWERNYLEKWGSQTGVSFGARRPQFKPRLPISCLQHIMPINLSCISFLICKMRIMVPTSQGCVRS